MLEDSVEPIAYDAAFWMQALEDDNYPVDELGRVMNTLADDFRTLAIAALLTSASVDGFCHNLIRSSLVRITYFGRIAKKGVWDDHFFTSGRYLFVVDAIVAGRDDLALRIATASPRAWREHHEYLDDYCVAQTLHRLLSGSLTDAELQDLTLKFADDIVAPDSRMSVLTALYRKDDAKFRESFASLIQERQARIDADIARGQLETPTVVAARNVFLEGLAYLRLADHRGLRTEAEYLFCPSLARKPTAVPFPGE